MKTRAIRQQRAVNRRHRKALKAAIQRNGGTSSQLARKASKRRKSLARGINQPVSVNMPVFQPFLELLTKPRKLDIEIPDKKPFKPFQSNRKGKVA